MNDFLQSLRNGQAEKQRTPKTRKNSDNSYSYSSSPRYQSYGGYQNNRSQHMKRPPMQQSPGNQMSMDDNATTSMLAEAVETLSSHIETLAKNQDYLVSVQERTADMLERQAIAIERIVDHLNIAPRKKSEPENKKPRQPTGHPAAHAAGQPTFKHHYVSSQEPEVEPEIEPVKPAKLSAKPIKSVKTIKSVKAVIRKRKKIVTKKSESIVSTDKALLSREKIMDIIQSMRAEGSTFDQVASRLVELGQPTFSGRGEWHAQTIHRLCSKK
jgi:hypothetical protein